MSTDNQILSDIKSQLRYGDRKEIARVMRVKAPYVTQIINGDVPLSLKFVKAFKRVVSQRELREKKIRETFKSIINE